MAIKVKLRQKPISHGRNSLYLDFYPAIPHPKTGKKTRREFLGLYVHIDKDEIRKDLKTLKDDSKMIKQRNLLKSLSPLSPIEKKHNQETLKIAQSIRQQRENELNKPEIYNKFEKEQLKRKKLGEKNFIKYVQGLADKRNDSNRNNWLSALEYLKEYAGEDLTFADLDEKLLEGFKEHLLTAKSRRRKNIRLSQNSASSYFLKIKKALKQAYKDGNLITNLSDRIEPIKVKEVRREFLSLEELNSLVHTPCNEPLLKTAALFSALTGLRFSDIAKLKWKELRYSDEYGHRIYFDQKKTNGVEYHDISEQAYKLLGEPGEPEDKVFEGLTYSAYSNTNLHQWIGAAGITRHITFHAFRHTYATLQLANGTDITTLRDMLGHKDIKTTLVYAKVIDQARRDAANRIKLDL